ncbi:MAG: phosphomannose isomerase type II C-terminal cupin domain [Candidatus Saccharicenans sp.]|nr:phosphomannose isomerase type II C-terminal cupin domain [Candidatus Saccharicenans sp.]MDH7493158.1 phosphomannose isomerase type II C-terminal cupin domain [Candidatus Saccharicenans sp.]
MDKIPDGEQVRQLIQEEERPWGKFRSYPHRLASSLKIITVNPGGLLSLQYHQHRSEYWIILDPGLEITLGSKTWQPQPGEEIFIPAGTPHRLKGLGPEPARVMELWLGDSGEEDIVRLDDIYGRD